MKTREVRCSRTWPLARSHSQVIHIPKLEKKQPSTLTAIDIIWYRSTIKSSRYWSYVHQLSFKGVAHIAGIDGFWTDSVQKTSIIASFSKVDDHPARMWRTCIFCQHFNLTALRYIAGKANHRLMVSPNCRVAGTIVIFPQGESWTLDTCRLYTVFGF